MYRNQHHGQLDIEACHLPFNGTLDPAKRSDTFFINQSRLAPSGHSCVKVNKRGEIMPAPDKSQRTFSLSFVENINRDLSQRRRSLRRAHNRSAAIQSLMIINKSDLEIQTDLQRAFANVTHESR